MKQLNKLTYVKDAENVINDLGKSNYGKLNLSTNQIRNLLTMINELYSMAKNEQKEILSEEIQSHVQYIKMKFVYEAGREKGSSKKLGPLAEFYEKSNILSYLDDIGDNREKLILVCHYMEALVAYHKFITTE